MKYLFDDWAAIESKIKGKYLFVFLDFDGTLVPIAPTPSEAVLTPKVKKLLKRLADSPRIKVAVISGRALEDIKNKVGLKNIIYSGNHGLEMEGPKFRFKLAAGPGYRQALGRVKEILKKKIRVIDGALVEDKGLSLGLHYRLVNKKNIPLLKTVFHETTALPLVKNKIKVKPGKMVLEVRPPVNWDKGRAVLWLLGRRDAVSKKGNIFPVYIGDDMTDEDAFRSLKNKGLTIFAGKKKRSQAKYYLRDHDEVPEFLKRVLALSPS